MPKATRVFALLLLATLFGSKLTPTDSKNDLKCWPGNPVRCHLSGGTAFTFNARLDQERVVEVLDARAWVSLSIALLSLFLGFHLVSGYKLFYSVYFFGEYAFGLMFIGGCRYLASGVSMTHRCYSMLIPAALLAIALPWLSADFNDLFMVQATVMAGLFAA